MKIKDIWFEDNMYLCGVDAYGNVYKQSLLWYPALRKASQAQREVYEMSFDGFHWPELDEDVSFESFFYDDAEPSPLQAFFLSHPEINRTQFARMCGLEPKVLQDCINGFRKEDSDITRRVAIKIRELASQYSEAAF